MSRPGLTVLPASDFKFVEEQEKSADLLVCDTCRNNGSLQAIDTRCNNCGHSSWVAAVV